MRGNRKHHMDGVFVLLLFSVLAVSMLAVLLNGAGAYRRLTLRDQDSYDRRTAAQYLAARVRQADAAGAVWIGGFGGQTAAAEGDTLFLLGEEEGERYVTRVYCCNGYLRELFAAGDADMEPEDGAKILAAEALYFSRDGEGRLLAELTQANGETVRLVLSLRCGEEAAP